MAYLRFGVEFAGLGCCPCQVAKAAFSSDSPAQQEELLIRRSRVRAYPKDAFCRGGIILRRVRGGGVFRFGFFQQMPL